MALNITKNHWAFLDEIEAPMWVDLALEAKFNYKDIDDGWFHTSHMFHQWPSFELKVALSHSGASSDMDSPKLPSSVSRSRGKDYGTKKQKGDQHIFPLDKHHPVKVLSGKSSWVNSGSGEEIKPKVSFINSQGTSRSSFVERNLAGNAKNSDSKSISSHGASQGSLSCMVDKQSDSNTSTITSEKDQQPQLKNMEVSSQLFGYSSGLLSAMRTSLRKSCVTRQASRVDVSNRRKSREGDSMSGKSSVGSSSIPGYDIKNSTFRLKQQREKTPDGRNENKAKRSTVSKAFRVQVKDGTGNSRRRGIYNVSQPAQNDATESKVRNQTLRAKALMPHGVNEQCSLIKDDKITVCGRNRFVTAGNENMTRRLPVIHKCHGGDITTRVMARGQNGTKQDAPERGLVGFKEKISGRTTRATQRVHQ